MNFLLWLLPIVLFFATIVWVFYPAKKMARMTRSAAANIKKGKK